MSFKAINPDALTKFNSAISSEFIKMYEGFVLSDIQTDRMKPSSKSFAPSSIRCMRKSWFRLRGKEPDKLKSVDATLEFKAKLGTAIHENIQSTLSSNLAENWVDTKDYLNSIQNECSWLKQAKFDAHGFETRVELSEIPIRFSVDGILKLQNELYLLEIKTLDFGDFNSLTDIKQSHIDQVKTYLALLNLENAIVMYVDRQYGSVKCYSYSIKQYERDEIFNNMYHVLNCVESNIAPDRLDYSDYMCTNCPYKKSCKEWG